MCYLLGEWCFVPYLGLARTVLLCDGHHQHGVGMVAVAKLDLEGLEEGSPLEMCYLLGECLGISAQCHSRHSAV
jgi:hypothetical protein